MYSLKKLSQICEIERWWSPRPIEDFITDSDDWVNWIKIWDTKNVSKYIESTNEKIKPDWVKRSRMVYPWDFILSNSMSFGRPYIMKTSWCIHDWWLVLRTNKEIINDDFLYLLLWSDLMYQKFKHSSSGTTVKNLNISKVKEIEIPLPPLTTQQKIVAKLDEAFANIDRQIALIESNIEDVENMGKSVLEDIFASGKSNRKNLGKILTLNYWKAVDKSDKLDNWGNDVYGANGIMYKSKKYLFDGESIIVWRKWSAWALNRVSGKFWASDVTYFVTTNDNIDYLYYGLMFLNLPQLAKGVKPWINRNEVYLLEIPLPSLSDQKSIVDYINWVFEKNKILTSTYESQISDLERLKQSLLQDAFEGKLITE